MRKISLNDWTLFSERMNSKNFVSKDGKLILKTSNETDYSIEDFEKEIRISKDVASLGIPTPKALEIVKIENGGIGLISEYIKDKKSISRAISEEPDKMESFIREYADLENKIHTTECDTHKFISIEERIDRAFQSKEFLSQDEIQHLKDLERSIPPKTTCLHTDSHYGNIITAPQGVYAIDIGLFSYGNPIYDIGLLYYFSASDIVPEAAQKKIFHMDRPLLKKCWRYFLKYSQGIVDEKEIQAYENKVAPFGFLTFLAHSTELNMDEIIKEQKKIVFSRYFQ